MINSERIKSENKPASSRSGQVMLLTAILISGIVLSATSLAGLLTIYQLRQVTDVTSSTKAIFAADSGIEWELYKNFKDSSAAAPELQNGATFKTFIDPSVPDTVTSVGTYSRSSRAFQLNFNPTP